MSVFLTETPTRHSLLTKQKQFRDKAPEKLTSNSSKLISETNETPIDLDANEASDPIILQEDSDEDASTKLDAVPTADEDDARPQRRSKRPRNTVRDSDEDDSEDLFVGSDEDYASPIEVDSDVEGAPPPKRQRKQKAPADGDLESEDAHDKDDKKKMAMDISFEGFAIYGRVLCLVVKKRETLTRPAGTVSKASAAAATGDRPGGQATMENWISSTQMPNPGAEEVEVT